MVRAAIADVERRVALRGQVGPSLQEWRKPTTTPNGR
jgi:hypothetical protein